jgi:hypothetical protein
LAIEYFKKSSGGYRDSNTNDIIGVVPPELTGMWKDETRYITVNFDKPFSLDDYATTVSDQQKICTMVSDNG